MRRRAYSLWKAGAEVVEMAVPGEEITGLVWNSVGSVGLLVWWMSIPLMKIQF